MAIVAYRFPYICLIQLARQVSLIESDLYYFYHIIIFGDEKNGANIEIQGGVNRGVPYLLTTKMAGTDDLGWHFADHILMAVTTFSKRPMNFPFFLFVVGGWGVIILSRCPQSKVFWNARTRKKRRQIIFKKRNLQVIYFYRPNELGMNNIRAMRNMELTLKLRQRGQQRGPIASYDENGWDG